MKNLQIILIFGTFLSPAEGRDNELSPYDPSLPLSAATQPIREFFTSTEHMKILIETEKQVINIIKHYTKQEPKSELLQEYLEYYRRGHKTIGDDWELYISNPINAFLIIKRLAANWAGVEEIIRNEYSPDYLNFVLEKYRVKFPDEVDLQGAMMALIRLQVVYHLKASSLAKGWINGVKYGSRLTAQDCFGIGAHAHLTDSQQCALEWMEEALRKIEEEHDTSFDALTVLPYIEKVTARMYETGEKIASSDIFEGHKYKGEVLEKEFLRIRPKSLNAPVTEEDKMYKKYEALCRDETVLSIETKSKLSCRYFFGRNNYFLMIAPFKVEQVFESPNILIFYDVLSDKEISIIKNISKSRLTRAAIFGGGSTDRKITKVAWIFKGEHKITSRVYQRISDMTGLSVTTAEDIQVANYGIGGHYFLHYDYLLEEQMRKHDVLMFAGNRIATVLFYMNDVIQGGATVFPKIDVRIWPKKGSAAFWYNLHPSGDRDILTMHGACPVLVGTKWAINLWLRERGQEFLRPCALEKPDEDMTL